MRAVLDLHVMVVLMLRIFPSGRGRLKNECVPERLELFCLAISTASPNGLKFSAVRFGRPPAGSDRRETFLCWADDPGILLEICWLDCGAHLPGSCNSSPWPAVLKLHISSKRIFSNTFGRQNDCFEQHRIVGAVLA